MRLLAAAVVAGKVVVAVAADVDADVDAVAAPAA